MATRHEQQIGKWKIGIGKPRAERVPFQMIHRDQQHARRAQRLAGDEPHHELHRSTRPGGSGDRIDIGKGNARVGERRRDEWLQHLDMRTRQFRAPRRHRGDAPPLSRKSVRAHPAGRWSPARPPSSPEDSRPNISIDPLLAACPGLVEGCKVGAVELFGSGRAVRRWR